MQAQFPAGERVNVTRPIASNLNYKTTTTTDDHDDDEGRNDGHKGARAREGKGGGKGMQIRGVDEAWYTPAEVNEYKQALSKTGSNDIIPSQSMLPHALEYPLQYPLQHLF